MSMNWQIRLLGDPLDLHELSKSLDSPDLSIKKDDEGYKATEAGLVAG